MKCAKKIIYMDGGLASQMSAYAFFIYLKSKGLEPEIDFVWYKRLGRDKYKLKEVFNIDVLEYKGSFKYSVFISNNIVAKLLRKTNLLRLLITTGIIQKLYYTIKPPWGGLIFNIDHLPSETFDANREMYFWGYWPMGGFLFQIRDQLISRFTFPKFNETNNINLAEDINLNNSVSVHVRKGDYLHHKEVFAEVTLNYYKNAVKFIKENVNNPKFYVFSDDIRWCEQEFDKLGMTNSNTVFINWNYGDKSYRDMQLMSLCKHNIITNSGFSTWAAFLNQNPDKVVVKPKEYFTKEWIMVNGEAGNNTFGSKWMDMDN